MTYRQTQTCDTQTNTKTHTHMHAHRQTPECVNSLGMAGNLGLMGWQRWQAKEEGLCVRERAGEMHPLHPPVSTLSVCLSARLPVCPWQDASSPTRKCFSGACPLLPACMWGANWGYARRPVPSTGLLAPTRDSSPISRIFQSICLPWPTTTTTTPPHPPIPILLSASLIKAS